MASQPVSISPLAMSHLTLVLVSVSLLACHAIEIVPHIGGGYGGDYVGHGDIGLGHGGYGGYGGGGYAIKKVGVSEGLGYGGGIGHGGLGYGGDGIGYAKAIGTGGGGHLGYGGQGIGYGKAIGGPIGYGGAGIGYGKAIGGYGGVGGAGIGYGGVGKGIGGVDHIGYGPEVGIGYGGVGKGVGIGYGGGVGPIGIKSVGIGGAGYGGIGGAGYGGIGGAGYGGYGGEAIDKSVYSGGQKNLEGEHYVKSHGNEGSQLNHGGAGFSKGETAIKDVKGESHHFSDVDGGKKAIHNGKEYNGGEHFDKEGKQGAEKTVKQGHKKGHNVKGFKSSHHKDETGKTEEFYDEFHDEGGNYGFDGHFGSFGEAGASSVKGGHEDGKFNAGEAKKSGHFDNVYLVDKAQANHGKFGGNKYAGNEQVYGANKGIDEHDLSGHHESSKFYKSFPIHY